MADVNYKANEGTPEQLPRGQADALNENTNVQAPDAVDAQPVANAPEEAPADQPQELSPEDAAAISDASPQDQTPMYDPVTDDEQFILGPTTRPDESPLAGTEPTSPISPRVRIQLPVLQRAAQDPGASDELKLLVQYLLRNA